MIVKNIFYKNSNLFAKYSNHLLILEISSVELEYTEEELL
jgi:hypothetical protein